MLYSHMSGRDESDVDQISVSMLVPQFDHDSIFYYNKAVACTFAGSIAT